MTPDRSRVFRRPASNCRGFTLVELSIGLGVIGLLTLMALPRIQQVIDRAQVKSARTATFNHLMAARLAAQHGGRLVVFKVSGGLVWSEAEPRLVPAGLSVRDTLGPVIHLAAAYGLNVFSTVDSIVFDPRGLGMGTGKIRLTRGVATDSVAVSGLGSVVR